MSKSFVLDEPVYGQLACVDKFKQSTVIIHSPVILKLSAVGSTRSIMLTIRSEVPDE